MISISLDNGKDITIDMFGNLALLTGKQAIAQNTRTAMRAVRGEMVYAITSGLPMRATAFDRYNPAQFEAAARAVMLAVPGVLSVDYFKAAMNGDTLDYSATISTTEGVIDV